jgi:hypothetical protein
MTKLLEIESCIDCTENDKVAVYRGDFIYCCRKMHREIVTAYEMKENPLYIPDWCPLETKPEVSKPEVSKPEVSKPEVSKPEDFEESDGPPYLKSWDDGNCMVCRGDRGPRYYSCAECCESTPTNTWVSWRKSCDRYRAALERYDNL